MRYSIQRYDDVFGTTNTSMICDDTYFNRSETSFNGSGSSLQDCVDEIISFLGTNDPFNLNGLRYIPVTGSPYDSDAQEVASVFNAQPYTNITLDGNFHRVTGIIKIENKTTTFTDWSWALNSSDGNINSYSRSYESAWSSTPNGYSSAPWVYYFSTSVRDRTIKGSAGCTVEYFALPASAVNDEGVIEITNDMEIARIHINLDALDIDPISLFPTSYQCMVQINYFNIPETTKTLLNQEETEPQDDPNNDPFSSNSATGGQSGTGGGHYGSTQPPTGTYSPSSDPNPVPSLPTISASDTGFITLFNPTSLQLKNLASYMWGSLFDVDTWKKIFADPMECILGLSIVPVNVPTSGTDTVKVGNISTGISMNKASTQFVELDCGSISITEYWKAYLDYSPYTKLNIYLPYIGAHELNIDDIQINTIGVKYHIDALSGACVAFITAGGNVIAQYSGQCAISIPVTSKDFTQTIIALGTLVAGGAAAIATGGLSAPVTAASVAGGVTAAANTAANVATAKPSISKSGNMGGSNGLMGVQKPYLFITRPKQCAPKNQNKYTGYPSYISERMGNLSGFTQIQEIRLDGISCTDEEHNEIMSLLRSGVII